MFRRHVLAALDAGITASDEDAARAALRRIDPLARGFARRRLERRLIDAALACDAVQMHTPPGDHVMRLAALAVARQDGQPADVEATATAYAQLPKRRMPRLPLFTLTLVVLLGSLAAAGFLVVQRALQHPPRVYARKLPPPSADAFQKGGVPLRDADIDKLFTSTLTDLVVQGARVTSGNDNTFSTIQGGAYLPQPLLKRGVPVTKAWDHMLDVLNKSVQVGEHNQWPTEHDYNEIAEAVQDLTAQLQAAGFGYFLEGRFKGQFAYVQAYRVEEVTFVTTNGSPRRVLSLRRLDKLNSSWAVLGMHTEDQDPVLHLERIDENVATDVMPVLADGISFPIADREWLIQDPGKALAAKIGNVVRREYKAALGGDAGSVNEIAKLLTKRNDIVDEWRDHLERKHIYFVRTENLFLPPDLLDNLKDVTPNYQRNRVKEIEERLAELEAPRIHARIHDLVAATTRRHEAQHGFDYDRDTELRFPQQLVDFVGAPHDDQGNPNRLARSARAELAAYLSQVINDPVTPHASLWDLGISVFHRDRQGTGEYYAGIVVIEGLARHLGATVEPSRYVTREGLAKLAMAVADAPPDKLRAAAKALWTELFGEAPTTIVDAAPRSVIAQAH